MKNSNTFSDINNFRKVVNNTIELLEDVDSSAFLSPYSYVPIISQIIGLNSPLMGSGNSPYSIISMIFQIQSKKQILRDISTIPLDEKRLILDEIYEMIAPLILGEEDNYIELLAKTKYHKMLSKSQKDLSKFIKTTKDKYKCLKLLFNRLRKRNGAFAHIVHYGYPDDLYREYDFLERMPGSVAEEWRNSSFPIVNEMVADKFPSYKSTTKKTIRGWIIFVPNHTRELLENGKLRKRKIIQAVSLAEKLGAEIIGMGGLIASFAGGGYELSQQFPDVGFTTGHAFTISNIMEIMDRCIENVGLNLRRATVSIVGAAGSIGSGCAKLLAERCPREINLIDLSTFGAQKKVEAIIKYVENINPNISIHYSDTFESLRRSDIIIAATNAPKSLISSKHLKKGAIVIDDSFPKNIAKSVLSERKDIILLEGGIVRLPLSSEIYFGRNMPDLLDAPLTRAISCKEIYGCVAETLILALYDYKRNYGIGTADPKLAKEIINKAKRVGFSSAPLQCYDEAVDDARFEKIRQIVDRD